MPDVLIRAPKPKPPIDGRRFVSASVILQRLHDEAPADHFTLEWLLGRLRKHSFGIIILMLAVIAMAPGICVVAGLLLTVPALQMVAGHPAPVFPRRIATRPLPTRHLARLIRHAVPALKHVEKIAHPRWPIPHEATKRVVGVIVIILTTILLLAPLPLLNVVPALVIALISLAYLEEDGLLLVIALLATVVVSGIALASAWELALGAEWITDVL